MNCENCPKIFCTSRLLKQLSGEQLLEYRELRETIEEKIEEAKNKI